LDPELDPESDPDLDPLVRGTHPDIRIRTKMSRIPNTAFYSFIYRCLANFFLYCGPDPDLQGDESSSVSQVVSSWR
jgi:hypothetical protein